MWKLGPPSSCNSWNVRQRQGILESIWLASVAESIIFLVRESYWKKIAIKYLMATFCLHTYVHPCVDSPGHSHTHSKTKAFCVCQHIYQ